LIEVTGRIEYRGVKGRFHCALMAGLKQGAGDAGQRPTTLHCEAGEGSRRKEKTLTGGAQMAAREKSRGGGTGSAAVFGPEEEVGCGEKAGRWAKREGGKEMGLELKKEREGERGFGEFFSFFLFTPFSNF
jgi:hypothetical protein